MASGPIISWQIDGETMETVTEFIFSSVLFISQSCLTVCDPVNCSMPGLSVHHQLPSVKSMMPSSHLILCHPLFLLPPMLPSIRVFSNESTLHMRWPKYWSFSFSISPSNEYSGLISFRMDWLDLLAVQGTLKSTSCNILKEYFHLCVQIRNSG